MPFFAMILARVGVKGILIGLAALAVGLTIWRVLDAYYDKGVAAERARVERANEEVRERAAAGAARVRDCYARGDAWEWRQATRACERTGGREAVPRPRPEGNVQ